MMKNKEKFHDEIVEIACSGDTVAVDKVAYEVAGCSDIRCSNCLFYKYCCTRIGDSSIGDSKIREWWESEYVEPPINPNIDCNPNIDWSKVPVDTPIFVRHSYTDWVPRYFAKYECGKVYAYLDGATSWSSEDDASTTWEFVKLAESD